MQVVAAVISDGTKVMVARRASGRSHAGLWEFPGGKVEADETPTAALVREIREELSLEIAVGRHLVTVGNGLLELSAYSAVVQSGSPVLQDHDALAWLDKRELLQIEMPELDQQIRDKL